MARLRRTTPSEPGWTRRRAGRGFVYLDESGRRLPEDAVARIRALVIPPAWKDVWICPHPHGHLQAVGTDDAGRRQYLYHPDWRARRDDEKFRRARELGRVLPRARRQLIADLDLPGVPPERACATAVRLLDLGYFRIGSDVYVDENGSFGLTTLLREHVRRTNGTLCFAFPGKSGIEHCIDVDDPAVLAAVEAMRRRRSGPERLLVYRDSRAWRAVDAATVNDYLRSLTGLEVTAKDFRTWHATVLAAAALAERGVADSAAKRRRHVAAAMREVGEYLGNTPAVARSSYVDPGVVDAYDAGEVVRVRSFKDPDRHQAALERATLRLLG